MYELASDHDDYGCSRSVSAIAVHYKTLRYVSFCDHWTPSDDELSPQNTLLFRVHGASNGTLPCLGKLLGVGESPNNSEPVGAVYSIHHT